MKVKFIGNVCLVFVRIPINGIVFNMIPPKKNTIVQLLRLQAFFSCVLILCFR